MSEKRKIVIIGSAYPLRGGGISTFNERLAKAYNDNGDQAIIYNFSLQYPSIFFPGTTQYSKEPPPAGLDIRVRINSINPFNWRAVGKEISKLKPDLVVVRFWIPFMAPCLGTICRIIKKNGIKVVAITDNIIPHEKKLFDRSLARYFVNSVDYFVTMSKSVLSDLTTFDKNKPKKLTVHPLYDNFGDPVPKDGALKKLKLSADYQYLLFFGFIRDYKGLDILLKAISDNRFNDLKIKLLVVGEFYSDSAPYLKLIDELGIKEKVLLHNEFVPNTEIVNYFCASSIVVQPYKEATQSGITQIAYHFNKPMITTDVGGLSEMVPDGKVGFVTNPDPAEIADSIYKFFTENLEEVFTENVKKEKNRFSWETMLNAIEEVIGNK
jgi:glycosyltransferase involved in cell wall biosynthesis